MDTVMDRQMMNRVTRADRFTELPVIFFRQSISENRAVKPNTVVTPVEIRQSIRETE